ncbi:hypothetical protein DM02DRAFT_636899 [Periconia macrospinosa]|uniref:FAD-binding PCMH-type domain-containing protein n=1 Tax=Periconia macrospinosa TaxID=97972 RepID=A0A2V1CXV3_9PLEO|nr:hypothetical protein DM02DRAFT_636899 [Periconia macrospinosa]
MCTNTSRTQPLSMLHKLDSNGSPILYGQASQQRTLMQEQFSPHCPPAPRQQTLHIISYDHTTTPTAPLLLQYDLQSKIHQSHHIRLTASTSLSESTMLSLCKDPYYASQLLTAEKEIRSAMERLPKAMKIHTRCSSNSSGEVIAGWLDGLEDDGADGESDDFSVEDEPLPLQGYLESCKRPYFGGGEANMLVLRVGCSCANGCYKRIAFAAELARKQWPEGWTVRIEHRNATPRQENPVPILLPCTFSDTNNCLGSELRIGQSNIAQQTRSKFQETDTGFYVLEGDVMMHDCGMALPVDYIPIYTRLSVGGFFLVGGHGSSTEVPTAFGHLVTRVTYIDGNGEIREEDKPTDWIGSMGMLGVVTEMNIIAVPDYKLNTTTSKESDRDLDTRLSTLLAQTAFSRIMW